MTTANPPNPVKTSSRLCWKVSCLKKGIRSAICTSASLSKPLDRRSSSWKVIISPKPWIESIAYAPNSPDASRALEPSLSTLPRIKNGLKPTAIRKGKSATAIHKL